MYIITIYFSDETKKGYKNYEIIPQHVMSFEDNKELHDIMYKIEEKLNKSDFYFNHNLIYEIEQCIINKKTKMIYNEHTNFINYYSSKSEFTFVNCIYIDT